MCREPHHSGIFLEVEIDSVLEIVAIARNHHNRAGLIAAHYSHAPFVRIKDKVAFRIQLQRFR
jgi:hypothetical protein